MITSTMAAVSGPFVGLLAGFLVVVPGCKPATQPAPASYAGDRAVSPRPGLVWPEYAPAEPAPGTDAMSVSARFLSVPRGALAGLVAATRDGVLDADSLRTLEAGISGREVIALASPTLRLHSGHRSHAVIVNQSSFISDYRLVGVPRAGPAVVDPIISVLDTGSLLDVEAAVEKGEIVFRRLEPQLVLKLGSRVCLITVPPASERVPCEEPVLLRAAATSSVRRVRDGDTFLVPLTVEVLQYTCQARALGGSFEESYTPAPTTWGEGPRDFFLLLSASVDPSHR